MRPKGSLSMKVEVLFGFFLLRQPHPHTLSINEPCCPLKHAQTDTYNHTHTRGHMVSKQTPFLSVAHTQVFRVRRVVYITCQRFLAAGHFLSVSLRSQKGRPKSVTSGESEGFWFEAERWQQQQRSFIIISATLRWSGLAPASDL